MIAFWQDLKHVVSSLRHRKGFTTVVVTTLGFGVAGTGKATHDEPPLIAHANAFLARGFAVLLYDKRGSGASTGDLPAKTP